MLTLPFHAWGCRSLVSRTQVRGSRNMHPATLVFSNTDLEASFRRHLAKSRHATDNWHGLILTIATPIFAYFFYINCQAAPPGGAACTVSTTTWPGWLAFVDWQLLRGSVLFALGGLLAIRMPWQLLVWLHPGKHLRLQQGLILLEWVMLMVAAQLLRVHSCAPNTAGLPLLGRCIKSMAVVTACVASTCTFQRLVLAISLRCSVAHWVIGVAVSLAIRPSVPLYAYFLELLVGVLIPAAVSYAVEMPARLQFLSTRSTARRKKAAAEEQSPLLPVDMSATSMGESDNSRHGSCTSCSSSGSNSDDTTAHVSSSSSDAAGSEPGCRSGGQAASSQAVAPEMSTTAALAPAPAPAIEHNQLQGAHGVQQQVIPSATSVDRFIYRSPLLHRVVSVKVVESQHHPQQQSEGSAAGRRDEMSDEECIRQVVTQAVRSSFAVRGAGNIITVCSSFKGCIRLVYHVTGRRQGLQLGLGDGRYGSAATTAQLLLQHAAAVLPPGFAAYEAQVLGGEGKGGDTAAWPSGEWSSAWDKKVWPQPAVLCAPRRQQNEPGGEGLQLHLNIPAALVSGLASSGSTLRVVLSEVSSAGALFEQQWGSAGLRKLLDQQQPPLESDPQLGGNLQLHLSIPSQLLLKESASGTASTTSLVVSLLQLRSVAQQQQRGGRKEEPLAFIGVLLVHDAAAAAELVMLQQLMIREAPGCTAAAVYYQQFLPLLQDMAMALQPLLLQGLLAGVGMQECLGYVQQLLGCLLGANMPRCAALVVEGVKEVPELLQELLVVVSSKYNAALPGLRSVGDVEVTGSASAGEGKHKQLLQKIKGAGAGSDI